MPSSFQTLADLAKINSRDLDDIDVTDLTEESPLFGALAADTASNGTVHKYTKQTGAPVVGFRDVNAGRDLSKSTDTEVSINLKILDASFAVDKALADAYMKGGAQAYIAREAKRHLKTAMFGAEKQFVQGTGSDTDGFSGFNDVFTALANTKVLDAGGTTAGEGSSIYLIRTGDEAAKAILGEDGNIQIGESVVQLLQDSEGKYYPAYVTPVTGWIGLQFGSANDIMRIANITTDAGKTANDDLIYDAISQFPAGKKPNLIAMGSRSLKQVRESRTATTTTGAAAPFPTEINNIPIIETDAIGKTETLLT